MMWAWSVSRSNIALHNRAFGNQHEGVFEIVFVNSLMQTADIRPIDGIGHVVPNVPWTALTPDKRWLSPMRAEPRGNCAHPWASTPHVARYALRGTRKPNSLNHFVTGIMTVRLELSDLEKGFRVRALHA